jgi:hypothetical protein
VASLRIFSNCSSILYYFALAVGKDNGFSGNGSSGGLDNSVKSLRVGYGDFAQHFAIQLDVGFFAAVDELAVSNVPLPTGCTEAHYPEASEISFAAFAVDAGVD